MMGNKPRMLHIFESQRRLRLLLCIGVALVLVTGCSKQRMETTDVWLQHQEIAKSSDSLSTSFSLYRWNSSLLTLGGDAGTFAARVLEEDGKNWRTVSTANPGWIPMDVAAGENRFVIARATLWSNRVEARFSTGSLSPDGRFESTPNAVLPVNKAQLFPDSPPNVEINENERPARVGFVGGVIEGANLRVPYSIHGTLIERKGHQIGMSSYASANGVFASSDFGRSWQIEPISTDYSLSPTMCRTREFFYYFAKGRGGRTYDLWYSRCPVESSSWSPSETINKTVARKLSEHLHARAEGEVVHLCWLDARTGKARLSLTRPRDGNYKVAYCNRRDSEDTWGQDVILSKGLRYAYSPSMSVEGDKVVVSWAGVRRDKAGRNEWNPSDIFYVTSSDSGDTWTKPIQITDGFKDGITSGRPQVALMNGVIHLFYIQGKTTYQEASAGMTLLNQPPWPIYYTRRPFPE